MGCSLIIERVATGQHERVGPVMTVIDQAAAGGTSTQIEVIVGGKACPDKSNFLTETKSEWRAVLVSLFGSEAKTQDALSVLFAQPNFDSVRLAWLPSTWLRHRACQRRPAARHLPARPRPAEIYQPASWRILQHSRSVSLHESVRIHPGFFYHRPPLCNLRFQIIFKPGRGHFVS